MEILFLIVIGGFVLFKFIIPAVQQTKEQMDDIGDASKYVKSDDPIVRDAVARNRFKHLVEKYKKKGKSEREAIHLAEQEIANNPEYLNY
jgi:hypothetical protein|tara:strand:+ start:381 stop:650 length:270 start_codon:yes stop_codon:yes gene_type:complete